MAMNQAERERRHQANLQRINLVQHVVGRGDRLRIDHEATLLERARLLEEEIASHRATELGLVALERLLRVVEEPQQRHAREVAAFVRVVWRGEPLPIRILRTLPNAVGDDVLAVLDAFRHGRMNLVEQVEGGPARVARALERWTRAPA